MKQLFSDDAIKNAEADQPWKKKDTDEMLDLYFGGMPLDRIAIRLRRNPKAVAVRIEQFRYNDRGRADRYQPVCRVPRRGLRLTENELLCIRAFRKNGHSLRSLSRVLQRDLKELGLDTDDLCRIGDLRKVGVGVDLILAYRYLYYVKGLSILSDVAYDRLEQEEMEFGAGGMILKEKVGSDRAEDYPPHVRALALYLAFKYSEREGQEKLYAIGEDDGRGGTAMSYGPVPSKDDALDQCGTSANSILFVLFDKRTIPYARWNPKKERWVVIKDESEQS